MKFLALIPARGGSKRLPGKNIRPLGGRPLIAWTIDLARQLGDSVDVLVSTDDRDIAAVASDCGAPVPWLRPPELATDTATSVDVAVHALDRYEALNGRADGLILLQPTSPFRRISTVRRGMELFSRPDKTAVVGLTAAHTHPNWCFAIEGDMMVPFGGGDGLSRRSQDLAPAYEVSGLLYIIEPDRLRKERSFFPPDSVPLVGTDHIECIDIDTEWDFLCAEKAVESALVHRAQDDWHRGTDAPA